MDRLLTYWWFWVGVVLILEGVALFFMMGRYKYHRVRNRKRREIERLIQQTRDAGKIGHHPCRFDGAVWHQGVCTKVACPPKNNRPKMGVVYYAAHR